MSDSGGKSEGEVVDTVLSKSVPEAGREYLGLGRDASYQAARRGEIPAIRIGHRWIVPRIAMERMLREAGQK